MATLAEYRARLDTDPPTGNQVGAIQREFYRLGFHVTADRAERLRLTAELARVPGQLGSTKDLTRGQAGRVVGLLTGCETVRDLYALTEPRPEPSALPVLLAALARLLAPLNGSRGLSLPGPESGPAGGYGPPLKPCGP